MAKDEDTSSAPAEGKPGDTSSSWDDDEDYGPDYDEEQDDENTQNLSLEEVEALKKKREEEREVRRRQKEEEDARRDEEEDEDREVEEDEIWNFPPDRENWKEEDLGEVWMDAPEETDPVGWDPELIDEEEHERLQKLKSEGTEIPSAPFYVPYNKYYPEIPENNYDVQTPEDAVEELERIEEILEWASYVFEDGSTYEGTVWDDMASGRGVYTTTLELCRYEGEWLFNMMEGHGVLEVDVPKYEPLPDSRLAKKMKQKGAVLKTDYMDPDDREWLKMDFHDQITQRPAFFEPFEDIEDWIKEFGAKPEKGRYKYSGQWKHSRFHGCGVYEINRRLIWGKFYFGEMLPDPEECTLEMCELHSSLAEVAAAKARMFVNKPDGMVREVKGPYTDPSHPYMYEEEDLWMAPGFINAYYEVPDEWKVYVEDLDKEREMWLNSFIKAPFVVPMPPELEYWWSQNDEFVVLGNAPSVSGNLNPENVERAKKDLQGEVLLHVPSGRIINWVEDDEGHLRFFLQPVDKKEVQPEAAIPLPLGFDDYFKDETDESSKDAQKKKNFFQKFQDAWKNSRKEIEEWRRKKKEELDEKWKQEDEVRKVQQDMKAMERKLAFRIKEEKIIARYQEIYEKAAAKKGTLDEEEQDEEVSPGQAEETVEAKDEEGVEGDQDKEDTKESSSVPDDEDQEDEDDKKPRSFGKVAMVDDNVQEKQKSKGWGRSFPTAFASLSLGQMVVSGEACKTSFSEVIANLLVKSRSQEQNKSKIVHFQPKSSSMLSRISFQNPTSSPCCDDIRLTVAHSSRQYTRAIHKSVVKDGSACNRSLAGRKARRSINRNCKMDRVAKFTSCKPQSFWCKPEFCFMSLAVPVEMQ